MFTFIILFTFIEACLDQSASEGQRKIAIFQYELVIILKPQILSELTMPGKCRGSKSPDMRVSCFCLLLFMWLLQFTVTVSVGISIQSLLLLKTSCAGGEELLKGQYIWQDFWVLSFAPCFYFPPNRPNIPRCLTSNSLNFLSKYPIMTLREPFYFFLRYNSWYQWKCMK